MKTVTEYYISPKDFVSIGIKCNNCGAEYRTKFAKATQLPQECHNCNHELLRGRSSVKEEITNICNAVEYITRYIELPFSIRIFYEEK